eukprot:g882.t1
MFYETSNKKDKELIAHTAFIVGTTSYRKSGAVRQKFLVLSRSGYQLFWEKVGQLQVFFPNNVEQTGAQRRGIAPNLIWRSEPHSLSGKLLPDAHSFEQDNTNEDLLSFSVRQLIQAPCVYSEDGDRGSKARVLSPFPTTMSGQWFAQFFTKAGSFKAKGHRLHIPSAHGRLQKVRLESSKFALVTVKEEERFVPHSRPPQRDQLAAPTMDELREHKGWTVAVMDGNHLFFYELADEKDPRWESSSIQLGEVSAKVLLCWPDPKS